MTYYEKLLNSFTMSEIGRPYSSVAQVHPTSLFEGDESHRTGIYMLNYTLHTLIMTNLVLWSHVGLIIIWLLILLIDSSIIVNETNQMYCGYVAIILAVFSSCIRPQFGQFSLAGYIVNYQYLWQLAKRGGFELRLCGQGAPPHEMSLLVQILTYLLLLSTFPVSISILPVLLSICIGILDSIFHRYRFCQGSCSMKDNWKTCPLVDDEGTCHIISNQPKSMFTLSYRWEADNCNGFHTKNIAILMEIIRKRSIKYGFIDVLSHWEDGNMATLDVNKTVYSLSDQHFIFVSKSKFDAVKLRLKIEFFFFFSCYH